MTMEMVDVWRAVGGKPKAASCPRRDLSTWIAHGWQCVHNADQPAQQKVYEEPASPKKQKQKQNRSDPKPADAGE